MNKVILLLILSDILILSAFGLISPIFAIFLKEGISGGSIAAAGLASAIFFIIKSVVQLPLARYVDTKKGKLGFLWAGTFLIVLVPFFYALSPTIKYIYLTQAVYALGAAMAYPAWFSLFTIHLDKKHRGFEWSLWSTGVGIGAAITAYLGALTAESFGFDKLFYIVGFVSLLGMITLLFLSKKFIKEVEDGAGLFRLKHQKT